MTDAESTLIIRLWSEGDIETIRNFVVTLAEFEKEPEAVTATHENYVEAYKSGFISGHLALLDEKPVGMTLFYENFSTWKGKMLYLEDFIVLDEYRRLGIGQKLFEAFESEASKRNCTTLKWQVLDWNQTAISFYKKNGADIQTQWWTCRKYASDRQ